MPLQTDSFHIVAQNVATGSELQLPETFPEMFPEEFVGAMSVPLIPTHVPLERVENFDTSMHTQNYDFGNTTEDSLYDIPTHTGQSAPAHTYAHEYANLNSANSITSSVMNNTLDTTCMDMFDFTDPGLFQVSQGISGMNLYEHQRLA